MSESNAKLINRLNGLDASQLEKIIALATALRDRIYVNDGKPLNILEKLSNLVYGLTYCELEGLVNIAKSRMSDDLFNRSVKRINNLNPVQGDTAMVLYPPDCKIYKVVILSVKKWTVRVQWESDSSKSSIPIQWILGVFKKGESSGS